MKEQLKSHCVDCLCLNVDCKGHKITECWTGCIFRRTTEKEALCDDTTTFAELDRLHELTRPKVQPQKPLWIKKREECSKNRNKPNRP